MALTYKYKTVQRKNGTKAKSPSIPIILSAQNAIGIMALLDSGADISAMPKTIAELIGCDITGKKDFSYGIGGRVLSITTKVTVHVEKGHERYTFKVPFKVTLTEDEYPVLLGRQGFFDKFDITFSQGKQKVTLKRVQKSQRI